jgi:AraC family transcriptional regulator, regulatory protein of adaptative response / DNA-3-methyladenine glycosylase II
MASTAPLEREQMLAGMYASDPACDGRFITGVLTTGIYCLPSCRARKPRPDNVRFFGSVADARAAGLRACRRCRPDDFYAGYDADAELATGVAAAVRRDPSAFAGMDDLVRVAGVGETRLTSVFRRHFHTTPGAFLGRARVDAACALLAAARPAVNEVGFAVGYEAVSTFYQQFRRHTGMTPGEYRRLGRGREFVLRLPADYTPRYAWRVLARQPGNDAEGVAGRTAFKVLARPNGPVVLRMEVDDDVVRCALDAPRVIGAGDVRAAHDAALRMLGLREDPGGFERRVVERGEGRLIDGRAGLRVPCSASLWEGLVWAVIGQQVNLPFACALRCDLIALRGDDAGGGLRAHPTPAAIADLDVSALRALRFSGRKAEYLIGIARAVVDGELDLDELDRAHATAVERHLLALRGFGPWSAQYVLMRSLGFADCVPVGDAALTLALQRYFDLDERPDAARTRQLMARFAPWRSLATFHLWQTLVPQE